MNRKQTQQQRTRIHLPNISKNTDIKNNINVLYFAFTNLSFMKLEIIIACGFRNRAYFYRKFTEIHNCSPKDFKEQKRKEQV